MHGHGGWNPPDVATPESVSAAMEILNRAFAKADTDAYRNHVEKLMMPLWFVQLSWPDLYAVSKDQGRATLASFKEAVKRNNIVNVSEAYVVNNDGTSPLVANMGDSIAAMDTAYAPPGDSE